MNEYAIEILEKELKYWQGICSDHEYNERNAPIEKWKAKIEELQQAISQLKDSAIPCPRCKELEGKLECANANTDLQNERFSIERDEYDEEISKLKAEVERLRQELAYL